MKKEGEHSLNYTSCLTVSLVEPCLDLSLMQIEAYS